MNITVRVGGKWGVEVTLDEPGVYPDLATDLTRRAVEAALDLWAAISIDPEQPT